jgi:hypothetical protein
MKLLNRKLLKLVTGAGANTSGNPEIGPRKNHGQNKGNGGNGGGFYASQGVEDCNNGIISGTACGALGFFGGPVAGIVGMAVGLGSGALAGGCFKQGNSNGGGGSGSNNSNCGDGGCSW